MPPKDFLKKLLKQCLLSWKSCCCYFFIISLIVDMKDHGTYWWWTLCVFSQLWWRCLYRDPLRDLNNIPRKWLMKFSHFSQSWYFVFILPCMLTCNCLLMFCVFSIPSLKRHFTNATAVGLLNRTSIIELIAPSNVADLLCVFFSITGPTLSISDLLRL